jgi:hypothetical protein
MTALPPDVAAAPQLAILDALDAVIEHAIIALVAAHPEIEEVEGALGEPPPTWLADLVACEARTLQLFLRRYRAALDHELHFRSRRPFTPVPPPRHAA